MKTIKDTRNDLLNRREVKFLVNSSSNPGVSNARKMVVDEFKAQDENIAIKNVKSKFGRDTFLIDACIYDSASDRQRVEPKIKVKKGAEAVVAPAGGKK